MIETVMLAGLGFLVANLIWLFVLPAISRRADRLAARRVELTFPTSMAEVAAERDHLRAEFAVRQRELERKAEAGFAVKARALTEIGERDKAIADLKAVVDDRDLTIAGLRSELASTQAELERTRTRLADEERAHGAAREDLAARTQSLFERDAEVSALRIERVDLTATLNQRVQELAEARAMIEAITQELAHRSGDLAQMRRDHEALGAEKDRLRILLAESETVSLARAAEITESADRLNEAHRGLAVERGAHAETRAGLESKVAAYSALDAERDSLALRLKSAEERIVALQAEARSLRTDKHALETRVIAFAHELEQASQLIRSAYADQARLEAEHGSLKREREEQMRSLKAEIAAAQGQAKQARAERVQLKQELAALRKAADTASTRVEAENKALRAEIVRIGDMFLSTRQTDNRTSLPTDLANPPDRPLARQKAPRRAAE